MTPSTTAMEHANVPLVLADDVCNEFSQQAHPWPAAPDDKCPGNDSGSGEAETQLETPANVPDEQKRPQIEMIAISAIRTDGGTQSRVRMDPEAVKDYTEAWKRGDKFPPVRVYFDGDDYWLARGFHRLEAAVSAGLTEINADVYQGTQSDARWDSYGANATHGIRRTNQDKQRALMAAIAHPNWRKWSDRKIAKHLGVDHTMIGDWRRKLALGDSSSDEMFNRECSGGRTMNVGSISAANRRRSKSESSPGAMDCCSEATTEERAIELSDDILKFGSDVPDDGGAGSEAEDEAANAQDDAVAHDMALDTARAAYQAEVGRPGPWKLDRIEPASTKTLPRTAKPMQRIDMHAEIRELHEAISRLANHRIAAPQLVAGVKPEERNRLYRECLAASEFGTFVAGEIFKAAKCPATAMAE